MNTTRRVKTFIAATMLAAAGVAGYASFASHNLHAYFALAVLGLAAATSRMKVKLPGINGNMSVNLPFLLTAIVNLSAAEAIVVTGVSTAVQCWPRKNAKFNPQQMAFNVSMMTFASCLASLTFHAQWLVRMPWSSTTLGMALAAVTLFLGQTGPVAVIIALSEGKAAGSTWWNLAHFSFPYYVLSAGVSSMVETVSSHMGWQLALAVFPLMYGIHRSYQLYAGKPVKTAHPQVLVRVAGAGR
ncbi:MAG: hypothetical protein ACLQBK_21015 [Candidatus Sulfotelmatobacter sp.]